MHASLLVVVAVVSLPLIGGGVPGVAQPATEPTVPPPNETDHGVNNSTFALLWSDDVDDPNLTADGIENASTEATWLRVLARSTDVSFEQPPKAVTRWNVGEHGEFAANASDVTMSVAPLNASLRSEGLIEDAYVQVFAVEPSTVVHRTNRTTLFVASEGRLYTVLDYRVAVPPSVSSGRRRVQWELLYHDVTNVTAYANGQRLGRERHAYTSVFPYRGLENTTSNRSVQFRVRGEIAALVRRTVQTCRTVETEDGPQGWNRETGRCEGEWQRTVRTYNHSVTVIDTRPVKLQSLQVVNGSRAAFRSEETYGIRLTTEGMWSRARFRTGDAIQSAWRFYTVSAPAWRRLQRHTAGNTTTNASTIRPLRVHAVPVREHPRIDASTSLRRPVDIELATTEGPVMPGASLPETVDISRPEQYEATTLLEVHSPRRELSYFNNVTLTGLVRGVSRNETFHENATDVYGVRIKAIIEPVNGTTARLRLRPVTFPGNDPVRRGQLRVAGSGFDIQSSGPAITVLVARTNRTVTVTYTPPPWWNTTADVGYRAATTRVLVPPPVPTFAAVVDLLLVTALWLTPLALVLYAFAQIRRRPPSNGGR